MPKIEYPVFFGILGIDPTGDSIILGDFNWHLGNNLETWRGVIGKTDLPDPKPSSVQLMDNTMFSHKSFHTCTCHLATRFSVND